VSGPRPARSTLRTVVLAIVGNVALFGGIAAWVAASRTPAEGTPRTLCDVIRLQPRSGIPTHGPREPRERDASAGATGLCGNDHTTAR